MSFGFSSAPVPLSGAPRGPVNYRTMSREQLVEFVDELQEELRQTRKALAPAETLPATLKLTRQEERLLLCLLKVAPSVVTKESLHTAIYTSGLADSDLKIVDVVKCKVNAKLKPFGLKIGTSWGRGYFAPVEMRETLLDDAK